MTAESIRSELAETAKRMARIARDVHDPAQAIGAASAAAACAQAALAAQRLLDERGGAVEADALRVIVSHALDLAHDQHHPGAEPSSYNPIGRRLLLALNESGLYDLNAGEITPAGHALQLHAAKVGPPPGA